MAYLLLAFVADLRAAHVGVVAGEHAHVDYADFAGLDRGEALFHGAGEVLESRHGADAFGALRARHHGEVDIRIDDLLADPLVLDRTAAFLRYPLLVSLVVVEGTVIGDEYEAGDLVAAGRP